MTITFDIGGVVDAKTLENAVEKLTQIFKENNIKIDKFRISSGTDSLSIRINKPMVIAEGYSKLCKQK